MYVKHWFLREKVSKYVRIGSIELLVSLILFLLDTVGVRLVDKFVGSRLNIKEIEAKVVSIVELVMWVCLILGVGTLLLGLVVLILKLIYKRKHPEQWENNHRKLK